MSTLDKYMKNAGHLGIIEKIILLSEDEDLKRLLSPPTKEGLINFFKSGKYIQIKNEESKKKVELLANLHCAELCKELIKEINQEIINCDDEGLSTFLNWGASYANVKKFFYDSNEYKKTELRLKVRWLLDLLKLRLSEDENIAINPILTKILKDCPSWIKEFADRMGGRSSRARKAGEGKHKKTNEAKKIINDEFCKIDDKSWGERGFSKKFEWNMVEKLDEMVKNKELEKTLERETISKFINELKRKKKFRVAASK